MEEGFLKYLVIMGVILLVVFLSQQADFGQWRGDIVGGVQNGGEVVKNRFDQTTEKISINSENIFSKIKNYFIGIKERIVDKNKNTNQKYQSVNSESILQKDSYVKEAY